MKKITMLLGFILTVALGILSLLWQTEKPALATTAGPDYACAKKCDEEAVACMLFQPAGMQYKCDEEYTACMSSCEGATAI
ncbi:MAG: hypothetical protein HY400_05065 [Elusimicrobia bacterium]|nr:hypothetical protein [Elusimicrobiota bacterium]